MTPPSFLLGDNDSVNNVAIVIPMYNEESSLPTLVYRMKCVLYILSRRMNAELFVVDDGSNDQTRTLIQEAFAGWEGFHLLRHEQNQGYSQALRTGIHAALTGPCQLIVTIDADTNYDHFYIPMFVEQFPDDCDILTASPWHPEGQRKYFPWHRLILSLGLSALYRLVLKEFNQPLYTYSSCFRVARADVYRRIHWTGDSFMANSEILSRCIINGLRVKEVPFQVNPRWFGMSKMRILRQIRKHMEMLWQLWRHPEAFKIDPAS